MIFYDVLIFLLYSHDVLLMMQSFSQGAKCFEGTIMDPTHLRKILGATGSDLIKSDKLKDMLQFIAANRMYLTKNTFLFRNLDPDSTSSPLTHEEYSVDFVTQIFYSADKVTPVHLGASDDAKVNALKLIEAGELRYFR